MGESVCVNQAQTSFIKINLTTLGQKNQLPFVKLFMATSLLHVLLAICLSWSIAGV